MRFGARSVLVGVVLLATGCAPSGEDVALPADDATADQSTATPDRDATSPAEVAEQRLCAEFPPVGPLPGDVEGWWSSSPADAEANILTDPADWPDEPREHPRVALVAVDTGEVISTWDRVVCGPDPHFVPEVRPDWPAGRVVAVDMDSGEMLQDVGPVR